MLKFSVNADAVFWGKDVYYGVEELARRGVKAFELWGWWDKDLDTLNRIKEKYGLTFCGLCPRFTSMVDTRLEEQYVQDFSQAALAAEKIGCGALFIKPGDKTDAPYEEQYNYTLNLIKTVAGIAGEHGLKVLLEPVSYLEAPNTFLGTSSRGFNLVRDAGCSNLTLLYDIYHMQLDEGNILGSIMENLDLIGHIHVSGIDGRHELEDGEIDYGYIFRKLK